MKRVVLLILGALFLVAAVPAKKKPLAELARVNDEVISEKVLREQFVKRHGGHEKFLGGEVELRKFLNLVVDQRLLVQEAYNLGLDGDEAIKPRVDAKREEKSVEYLLKSELQDKSVASPAEIREAWEKHTTTVVTARQIVLDTKVQADEVLAALRQGADFETLARACSTAGSKIYGGQLPPLGWGALSPEWEAAVAELEPGELSPVFRTDAGWEIVLLQDRTTIAQSEFMKAAPKIKGILEKRKLEERRRLFSEELFAKYHVVLAPVDHAASALASLKRSAPDTVLATWDGGSLKLSEFDPEPNLRMLSFYPSGQALDEVERQLRQTINQPLVTLEARARNIADVPEVAEAVRAFQEDLMEGALYDQHILKEVKVTDQDLTSYYDEHKAELTSPEKRRVAHIVVGTEESARALREQLENGENFIDLVKKNSLDTASAKEGGDLGWITKTEVPPEFGDVLKLGEGELSQPVKSKFGWHLIKVTAVQPERALTFDEAKEDIRKVVLQKKQREARAYWVKKLREAASIRFNDKGIRQFVKQNPFEETKEGK